MSIRQFLAQFPESVISQVEQLHAAGTLESAIINKYPDEGLTNSSLFELGMRYKNQYLKKSSPLSKIVFDDKISLTHQALGLHTYANRIQGSKIKSKNEIRVSSQLKGLPAALIEMVLVHELAHLKEKEHNKAFYRLCSHMLPDYHQREFDLKLLSYARQLNRS